MEFIRLSQCLSKAVMDTMLLKYICCLTFVIAVPLAWSAPLNHDTERGPLAAVSDLNSALSGLNTRMTSHASLLQNDRDTRLPLPSSQDLETIKKVAQILIMLGEQVLPSILGERPSKQPSSGCESPPQEIINDPVKDK